MSIYNIHWCTDSLSRHLMKYLRAWIRFRFVWFSGKQIEQARQILAGSRHSGWEIRQ
jgi:hypothetical protein